MWKKVLIGIPQGFIKITVIYKKAHRNFHGIPPKFFTEFRWNFSRNSAGIFHGIPSEFSHGIPFRGIPRNTEFRGIFHGIPRNFIPSEKFRGIPQNFSHRIFTEFRNSVWESRRKYNSAGFFFVGIMDSLHGTLHFGIKFWNPVPEKVFKCIMLGMSKCTKCK